MLIFNAVFNYHGKTTLFKDNCKIGSAVLRKVLGTIR